MKPQFKIGDKVKAISFTDCFDKFIPERNGLIVAEVRMVRPTGSDMTPYYRVMANDPRGGYVEGAERYFAAEVSHAV